LPFLHGFLFIKLLLILNLLLLHLFLQGVSNFLGLIKLLL
jgi:hypothetical protein